MKSYQVNMNIANYTDVYTTKIIEKLIVHGGNVVIADMNVMLI